MATRLVMKCFTTHDKKDKRKDLERCTSYGLIIWTSNRNTIGKWHKAKKVFLGTEFGALVDEIEVELVAEGLGIKYGYLMISSLLFVNDISIVSPDTQHLKKADNT